MAENKKSFVLYTDQRGLFSKLTDAKAGKLIKMIFDYISDNGEPKTDDPLLQIAFEPIKLQLKRDLRNWEDKRIKRAEAGRAGGIKSGQSRKSEAMLPFASKNEANEAVTVNGNATVNVNGNVNDTYLGSAENSILFSIEHCMTVAMNDERWVKANKATEAELQNFNSTLEKAGIYDKNPADYKTHFSRWKPKQSGVIQTIKQPISDPTNQW